MDFNSYQKEAGVTDIGVPDSNRLNPKWLYYAMGVTGEAGEMLEKVKKCFRDHEGYITNRVVEGILLEMGDVMWYMARLCSQFGVDFEDVPALNIKKLRDRMERSQLHGSGDNR